MEWEQSKSNPQPCSSTNSFLSQLQNKLQGGLRPTTTKTTFADGSVQYKNDQGSSLCPGKQFEKTHGFVVDEKPDLTIGQVTPWLFVSSQDVPNDPNLLKKLSISHILSLLPGFCLCRESQDFIKSHLILEVYDEGIFSLDSDLCREAFQFMKNAKFNDEKILVHCNAGISRAPSLVIAYLIQCENLSFTEAWEKVKQVRPSMRPNDGFVKQLKNMSAGV